MKNNIETKINEFKELTITRALEFIRDDTQFYDTRDLRDMVNIVIQIEETLKESERLYDKTFKDLLLELNNEH